MRYLRRHAILFTLILALLIAGVIVFVPSNKPSDNKSTTKTSETTTKQAVDYPTPTGWTSISSTDLESQGAATGITRASAPSASFVVAIEPEASTPSSDADIKSSTLTALNKLEGYGLIASSSVKVDGHDAQQFIYHFGATVKTKQQLIITVVNKQAYSLLFTSAEADFAGQATDFAKILAGFTFTN